MVYRVYVMFVVIIFNAYDLAYNIIRRGFICTDVSSDCILNRFQLVESAAYGY